MSQLSVFQLLKTGTSFKKCSEPQIQKTRKSSIDSTFESFEKFNFQKYNPDDSVSELQEPVQVKRRRKESMDRIEKELVKLQNQQREKIAHLRKLHRVRVSGDDVPKPFSNFTKMMNTLNRGLVSRIKSAGFEAPTPVQMQAIPIILQKRNLVAVAPTGSGKTLAFVLPMLQNLLEHVSGGPRCLIFAPTQELCAQIFQELIKFRSQSQNALKIEMILKIMNRTSTVEHLKKKWESIDIMVCTPLKYLKFQKRIQSDLSQVEYIVMDESDKYFEMGLINQIKQILTYCQQNPKLTYLLFSATIQDPVEKLFLEIMTDPIKLQIGGKNHVLNSITQSLSYCSNEYGKQLALKEIINSGQLTPPVLIFVQSKQRLEELFNQLNSMEFKLRVDCIHSDKNTDERIEIVRKFNQGEIWVLICTDLMARGIDFKEVKLVINYDFPNSMITYIHRVGRTGRAGMQGRAITFFTDEDKPLLRSLANVLKISGCEVQDWIFKLPEANQYQKKHALKFPTRRESIEDAKVYTHKESNKKVKLQ